MKTLKTFNWTCSHCKENFASEIGATEIRINSNVPLDLDDLDGDKGTCVILTTTCTHCGGLVSWSYTS